MGKVVKIQINANKGEPPVPAESCHAVAGSGIIGDRHAGKKEREICVTRQEILDWMERQAVKGFCFSKQKVNLVLEGFSHGDLAPGKQLVGKEVILKVADVKKRCFPEECALAGAGIRCRLREEYQMAAILRSGTIRRGEEFTVTEPEEERRSNAS